MQLVDLQCTRVLLFIMFSPPKPTVRWKLRTRRANPPAPFHPLTLALRWSTSRSVGMWRDIDTWLGQGARLASTALSAWGWTKYGSVGRRIVSHRRPRWRESNYGRAAVSLVPFGWPNIPRNNTPPLRFFSFRQRGICWGIRACRMPDSLPGRETEEAKFILYFLFL